MDIQNILNNANNLTTEQLQALLQLIQNNPQGGNQATSQNEGLNFDNIIDPYSQGEMMGEMSGLGSYANGGNIPMFENGSTLPVVESKFVNNLQNQGITFEPKPSASNIRIANYGNTPSQDFSDKLADMAKASQINFENTLTDAKNSAIRAENQRNQDFVTSVYDKNPEAIQASPFFSRLPQEIQDRVNANVASRAAQVAQGGNFNVSQPTTAPTPTVTPTPKTNNVNKTNKNITKNQNTGGNTVNTNQNNTVDTTNTNQNVNTNNTQTTQTSSVNTSNEGKLALDYVDGIPVMGRVINGKVHYSIPELQRLKQERENNQYNTDYKPLPIQQVFENGLKSSFNVKQENGIKKIYFRGKNYGNISDEGIDNAVNAMMSRIVIPDSISKESVKRYLSGFIRKNNKVFNHEEGGKIPMYLRGSLTPPTSGTNRPLFGYGNNTQINNSYNPQNVSPYLKNLGYLGKPSSLNNSLFNIPKLSVDSTFGNDVTTNVNNADDFYKSIGKGVTANTAGHTFNPITNKYEDINAGVYHGTYGYAGDEAKGFNVNKNGLNAAWMNTSDDNRWKYKKIGDNGVIDDYYTIDGTVGKGLKKLELKGKPLYWKDSNGRINTITEDGLYDEKTLQEINKGNVLYNNDVTKQMNERNAALQRLAGNTVYDVNTAAYKLGDFLHYNNNDLKPSASYVNHLGQVVDGSVSEARKTAGTLGKAMGILGSVGKIGSEIYRNVHQGYANAMAKKRALDTYNDRQRFDMLNQNNKTFAEGGRISQGRVAWLPYFAEGGEDEQMFSPMLPQAPRPEMSPEEEMTGEYIQQAPQEAGVQPNAEVEAGEYVQHPDGQVQQVEGRKHSEGGERVNLDGGTKIISDKLKLGAKNAKVINSMFDLKVKAGDTYASAVEKFTSKIGIKSLNEEQEKYFKKLKDVPKTKDEETNELNNSFLSEKIHDIEQRKGTLDAFRTNFVDFVFELQEQMKGGSSDEVEETGEELPQEGMNPEEVENVAPQEGDVQEQPPMSEEEMMAMQQGGGEPSMQQPSPEEMAMLQQQGMPMEESQPQMSEEELMAMQQQGQQPMMANGGYIPMYHGGGESEGAEFKVVPTTMGYNFIYGNNILDDVTGLQKTTGDTFGNVDLAKARERYMTVLPEMVDDYFYKDDKGNVSLAKGKTWLDFQKAYNDNLLKKAEFLYRKGYNKDDIQAALNKLQFINDPKSARHFDGKLGNFTATRGNFQYDVLTPEEMAKLKAKGIVGTYSFGKNRDVAKEILGEERFNVVNKDVDELGGLNIMFGLVGPKKQNGEVVKKEENPDPKDKIEMPKVVNPKTYERPVLPDMSLAPPDAMDNHLKVQHRFNTIDPIKLSPEVMLQELNRQNNAQMRYMAEGGLTGVQRAAYLTNLYANKQNEEAKQIAAINQQNAQEQARVDSYNAQNWDKEEAQRNMDAQNYEKMQMTSLNNTKQDENDYFEKQREMNIKRFNYLHQDAMINSMIQHYKVDENGNIVFDPDSALALRTGNKMGQSSKNPLGIDFENLTPEQIELYDKQLNAARAQYKVKKQQEKQSNQNSK